MNSFVSQYALFLAQTVTLGVAVLVLVAGLVFVLRRKGWSTAGLIRVTDVNRQLEAAGDRIRVVQLPRKARKLLHNARKIERKAAQKETEARHPEPRRCGRIRCLQS